MLTILKSDLCKLIETSDCISPVEKISVGKRNACYTEHTKHTYLVDKGKMYIGCLHVRNSKFLDEATRVYSMTDYDIPGIVPYK